MFDLNDKNVIVTGGASGIGLAISNLFARHKANVHILELNLESASHVAQDLVNSGYKAQAYKVNVANYDEVKSVVDKISSKGTIDILINNAGVAHVGNAENTSEADFNRLFDINVKGVYNCLNNVIPVMKKHGGGVILNMASIAANVGISDRFAYSMTKGAVKMMTLSVARDFIANNIRCNCISPARVHTPFVDNFIAKTYPGKEAEMFQKLSQSQPIGRMADPHEIATIALYLCSDEASFITGSDFPIDGGFIGLR